MPFTEDDLNHAKVYAQLGKKTTVNLLGLIARLEAAERAVDEASCLLDHPAFTVGTKSYDRLPQGMEARARSAKEAVDAWVKATGKYQ